MFRGKMSLWVVASAMAALSAVGCCQEQEKRIDGLSRDNKDLKDQNAQLRSQLQAIQQTESDTTRNLDAQLSSRDLEIARLRAWLNDPNSRRAVGGASGWEKGLFGDRITVGSDLLFASGSDNLKPGAAARLDAVVKDIKTHYPNLTIRVYGHTDSDPIRKTADLWEDNLELSANRAMTVARYLKAHGISAALIESIGMGAYHPIGTDKAKNRRVEIYVVKMRESAKAGT